MNLHHVFFVSCIFTLKSAINSANQTFSIVDSETFSCIINNPSNSYGITFFSQVVKVIYKLYFLFFEIKVTAA